MPQPALLLDSQSSTTTVLVHPVVLLHILDHHRRRPAGSARVIGTLLGRWEEDPSRTLEITNAFAVPHAERGDEVAIGKDFNKTMWALLQQHNNSKGSQVSVVGWYSSSPLLSDTSSLIHEFYSSSETDSDPVHLVVDCRLTQDQVTIRAFSSTPIVVQGESLGNVFHELPLSLRSTEPEAICVGEMIRQADDEAPTTTASSKPALQVSLEKLYELLETAEKYVTDVVEGRTKADTVQGRQLADALATVPRIHPEVMDKLFHDALQDLLMVTYLSNITQTQLSIAEKLNATLDLQ